MRFLTIIAISLGLFFYSITPSLASDISDEDSRDQTTKTRILYVPLDERPVNLKYVMDTMKAANVELVVPPAECLPNQKTPAAKDKLWQWVFDNSYSVDSMVLSTDGLVYGGLIASRIHNEDLTTLNNFLANLTKIKELNPDLKLYAFTTIMRTSQESSNLEEPDYYLTYGKQIFQITALRDKAQSGLTEEEQKRLNALVAQVPAQYLADWYQRREKNLAINSQLIELNRQGVLDYLIICRDDSATYSQSHLESSQLAQLTFDLGSDKYSSFAGADEVGMVLLTRAVNKQLNRSPQVFVTYAPGPGGQTIPRYEDQEIDYNIQAHILASGATPTPMPETSDLILAVNTPLDGKTREANNEYNQIADRPLVRDFVSQISYHLNNDRRVALADVAFANGADNTLMSYLKNQQLLGGLTSYAGWNTAGNTIGYALSQGQLAEHMKENDRRIILAQRILDDWGYQANVRNSIDQEILKPMNLSKNNLGSNSALVKEEIKRRLIEFTQANLANQPIQAIDVTLPWNRAFNIGLELQ